MGVVLASHSMSLDGFIVQADRTPGPLHEWLWSGDQPSRLGGSLKLSKESRVDLDLVPVVLGEGVRLSTSRLEP